MFVSACVAAPFSPCAPSDPLWTCARSGSRKRCSERIVESHCAAVLAHDRRIYASAQVPSSASSCYTSFCVTPALWRCTARICASGLLACSSPRVQAGSAAIPEQSSTNWAVGPSWLALPTAQFVAIMMVRRRCALALLGASRSVGRPAHDPPCGCAHGPATLPMTRRRPCAASSA